MATRGIEDYIKIEDLKGGYLYRISARNAEYGIWLPQRNTFAISRIKFGSNYIFEEEHWDNGPPYGTVKPSKEIEKSPFDHEIINIKYEKDEKGKTIYFGYPNSEDMIEYLNKFEGDREYLRPVYMRKKDK